MPKHQAEPLQHQLCREQVLRVKVCNLWFSKVHSQDWTQPHYLYKSVLQWKPSPMASSKRHCKNLFYNFPYDSLLSPWVFRKISGYHDKHRDKFYSKWTKMSAWTFTHWASLGWYKMLAAPVGVLHTTETLTLPQTSLIATCTKMEASSMPSRYTCL